MDTRWRNAKKEFPVNTEEEYTNVLLEIEGYYGEGYFKYYSQGFYNNINGNHYYFGWEGSPIDDDVTAWMPLPKESDF